MEKKDCYRWMPWDVIDWLLSDARKELHPTARSGYFDLLCQDWKDNGLSADNKRLQLDSGLSQKQWKRHGEKILSRFVLEEDGKYRNPRVKKEKSLAIDNLDKSRERTRAAREARFGICNSTVTEKSESSVTDIVTDTVTVVPYQTIPKKEIPTSSQPPSSTPQEISLPLPSPEPEEVLNPFYDMVSVQNNPQAPIQNFQKMFSGQLGKRGESGAAYHARAEEQRRHANNLIERGEQDNLKILDKPQDWSALWKANLRMAKEMQL